MWNQRENERLDDLQNGLFILQDPQLFCFGIDAVLLSAYAKVHPGEHCLDLGTGNGILPLLLSAKTKGESFVGLELNPSNVSLARRSVEGNHLTEKITILEGDICQIGSRLERASFEVVVSNPPYLQAEDGKKSDSIGRAMARHEIACSLEDVCKAASFALKEKGRLYMVHRPHRLSDLFGALGRNRLAVKRLRLVYPFVDKAPNLVLVEARKGGQAGLACEPALVIYEEPGKYTKEVWEMYGREMA